jgi:hypothetical protein
MWVRFCTGLLVTEDEFVVIKVRYSRNVRQKSHVLTILLPMFLFTMRSRLTQSQTSLCL